MRTQEILDALAQGGSVQVTVTADCCTVLLLHFPYIARQGKSVFDAAFQVAKHLAATDHMQDETREALEAYDRRTEILSI